MSTPWQPTLGAVAEDATTRFRVWAPRPRDIVLAIERDGVRTLHPLIDEGGGMRSASVAAAGPGTRYGYLVDGAGPFPDPCSRSQPDGVHALSEVVSLGFAWTDTAWTPPSFRDLVIYELHFGTFTPGGTFDSAIERLAHLAALGINAIEVMPVCAFPGRWNWGYDGVSLFAPSAIYGDPESFRRFIDAAHAFGLAVVLDVVFNHFGPDGNYTGIYSEHYLTTRHASPWGSGINTDGEGSAGVRGFFRENLLHWLHEYHVDGFRFDATHTIVDDSDRHLLAELAEAVEGHRHDGGTPYLIAESDENEVRYTRSRAAGGFGFDATWADDFHHTMHVALAGDRHVYFGPFDGSPAEIARAIRQGFLFEGQHDPHFGRERGTKARGEPWPSFVYCLQNHDQVANLPHGERIHSHANLGDVMAASMLLLLLPQTPMLFQGQEFFANTPFHYFTDHEASLGVLVTQGRRHEFRPAANVSEADLPDFVPDPQAQTTFERSKLHWDEASSGFGRHAIAFHAAMLELRRQDPVLQHFRRERLPLRTRSRASTLLVRFDAPTGTRWLALNFGSEAVLPLGGPAEVVAHTGETRFGRAWGEAPTIAAGKLTLPAHSGAFLRAPH